tara:strand:+ start:2936 stop:3187 length:252 start_codon:yes stop_codon:yes gene_type:complete
MGFQRDGHVKPLKVSNFPVAHVTFRISETLQDGNTFALVAGDAAQSKDRRPFFTGNIDGGMADQLRALADKIDRIQDRLALGG